MRIDDLPQQGANYAKLMKMPIEKQLKVQVKLKFKYLSHRRFAKLARYVAGGDGNLMHIC